MLYKKINYIKFVIAILIILSSIFFLFYNLGDYALWDDEAETALFAQSVWQTGDTYAILDYNIIAHTYGRELKNLYNRYMPPLAFYVAAPFVGLNPGSAFAARFPFAIFGLGVILILIAWLIKEKSQISTWILFSIGISGNVSLMLFSRQCRYYALSIFFSTVLVYLYYYRNKSRHFVYAIAITSVLLFTSNYLNFAALYFAILIDYLIMGKSQPKFTGKELMIIFIPQILVGGIILSIYNPFGVNIWQMYSSSWILDRVTLLIWNIRDMNNCELVVGIFLLLAPFLACFKKDKNLGRAVLGVFIYVLAISFMSPQPVALLTVAFVRYLAPIIPIGIYISVRVIQLITIRIKWLAYPIALITFGTNIFNAGLAGGFDKDTIFSKIIAKKQFRSSVISYTKEILNPPVSAYKETANWINENLTKKDSVWITPSYATYPLMYHAPKALYAWQLKSVSEQFHNLDDIHFYGKKLPIYVIAFGPYLVEAQQIFKKIKNTDVHYEQVASIDRYWYDLTRPELFWHSFKEIKSNSKYYEKIYIFKRIQ